MALEGFGSRIITRVAQRMEGACLERQRDNLLYRGVHLWRLESGWRKFGFGAVRSGFTVDAGRRLDDVETKCVMFR